MPPVLAFRLARRVAADLALGLVAFVCLSAFGLGVALVAAAGGA